MSFQERLLQVLISPEMTEKVNNISGYNQYSFKVCTTATKFEIKKAIEMLFKVKVKNVNVLNRKGKEKRRGNIKGTRKVLRRAYVTLCDGHSIDLIDK